MIPRLVLPVLLCFVLSLPVCGQEEAEPEVVQTESGLRYVDLVPGEGESPEAGGLVVVHYTGWLEDGTKFDSSVDRGDPFRFPIGRGRVIPGWDEGVASMKVGGKRKLIIPPELAYGERGAGGVIPPGATLVFEVELLEVVSPPEYPEIDEKKIVETASGLTYIDLVVGTGETPQPGAQIEAHYSGWREETKELFDSSVVRGKPLAFRVGIGQVIKGWDEGLSTMKPGGKRILIIPPDLAYGANPGGGRPGGTLVFVVELISVQ